MKIFIHQKLVAMAILYLVCTVLVQMTEIVCTVHVIVD